MPVGMLIPYTMLDMKKKYNAYILRDVRVYAGSCDSIEELMT